MANRLITKIGRMFQAPSPSEAHCSGAQSISDDSLPIGSPCFASESNQVNMKVHRFLSVLKANPVDLKSLRDLLWSGCHTADFGVRSLSWKLVLGYFPIRKDRFEEVLARKRGEYMTLLSDYSRVSEITAYAGMEEAVALLRQIRLDIPRTCINSIPSFSESPISRILERALFIVSYRNPACGYVQGMNDLAVPLLAVLLEEHEKADILSIRLDTVASNTLDAIEADLYWMLSKLLQDLQDNYIFSQPGIQKMNMKLREIIQRVDPDLADHFEQEQIDIMQISFRWFNCLLTREFNIKGIMRVWDTCISEEEGFSVYLVYLCAVMLTKMSADMKKLDFQGIMMLMSKNPYSSYEVANIETLLSEAFVLKSLFHTSPHHLASSSVTN